MKLSDAVALSRELGGAYLRHENTDTEVHALAPFTEDYGLDMKRLGNVVVTGDDTRHYALALAAVSLDAHGYDVAYIGEGYETLFGLRWAAPEDSCENVLRELAREGHRSDRITVIVADDLSPRMLRVLGLPDWKRGIHLIWGMGEGSDPARALAEADRRVDAPFEHSFVVERDVVTIYQQREDGVRAVSNAPLHEASQDEIISIIGHDFPDPNPFIRSSFEHAVRADAPREPRVITKVMRWFP